MKMRIGMLAALAGAALLAGGTATGWAAPFCVVDFAGQRCWYQNIESCRQAAGPQGSCVVNQQQMTAPVGGAPFCLVESWRTECVYRDLGSCEFQARRRRGACIANPNALWRPPTPQQGFQLVEEPEQGDGPEGAGVAPEADSARPGNAAAPPTGPWSGPAQ